MQRINLFSPEFLPKPQRFGLRSLMLVTPVTIAALLLVGLFLKHQVNEARALTAGARNELQSVSDQITHSQQNASSDANTMQQLQVTRQALADAQMLLTSLRAQNADVSAGFADVLQTLAAHSDERVWLTGITLGAHQVQLSGETLAPDRVPVWLAQLQQQPALHQQQFTGLRIEKQAGKPVHSFALNGDGK